MPLYVQVLLSLAPYIVPPLVALLVVVVKAQISKLPAAQRDLVSAVVSTQVAAVEQIADTSLNGPAKKQLALEAIQKELAAYHISVPDTVINGLLEETVLAINALPKTSPIPAPTFVYPSETPAK